MMNYLRSSKTPINFAVASAYMKLCGRSDTPDFEEKCFKTYDLMKRISPGGVFDAGTADNIIAGLYRTRYELRVIRSIHQSIDQSID